MTEKVTKKEEAFKLFDEGKNALSEEVKALRLKGKTRYNYYQDWQKARGVAPSSPEATLKANKPGKAISELKMIISHPQTEESEPEDEGEGGSEPEDEEEGGVGGVGEAGGKPDEKGKTGSNGKKSPPGMIAGQGLTFAITISTKTLMLYQIAASSQEEELTLGDFIDTCVEDTYRGRGLDLGLVQVSKT